MEKNQDIRVNLSFAAFADGPKDMLDACIAAVTTREFVLKRGTSVGGGDGLGSIVLPRPVEFQLMPALFSWPGDAS